jgi:hypothetical protein
MINVQAKKAVKARRSERRLSAPQIGDKEAIPDSQEQMRGEQDFERHPGKNGWPLRRRKTRKVPRLKDSCPKGGAV